MISAELLALLHAGLLALLAAWESGDKFALLRAGLLGPRLP